MKTKENKYQVAVIFYTYNSDLKKTLSSLRSAIMQTGIKHQIIVADDGSVVNHKTEIEKVFAELNFHDYKFSILENNMGITENLCRALVFADSKYIKILSPGDYLSDSDALARLYNFSQTTGCKVCFGDAAYFRRAENGCLIHITDCPNHPNLLRPYDNVRIREQQKNCLVLNDFILGASVFTETDIYREYINMIVGYVKYFEDNALRLMIYNGIAVRHYPDLIMWYECGDGISTNGSKYWAGQCFNDYNEANKLICETPEGGVFSRQR